jgi:hypothetical protein
MNENTQVIKKLSTASGIDHALVTNPQIAHVFIHHHKVVSSHLLPGLEIDTKETQEEIRISVRLQKGTILEQPVQMCFGMVPKEGKQHIVTTTHIEEKAAMKVIGYCTFPNAVDVTHIMDAQIHLDKHAQYSYLERHIHGEAGGVKVYPKAVAELGEAAQFSTEFDLVKGRVGLIDIDYTTTCHKKSVLEMISKINGKANDVIKIKEEGHLVGDYARGLLSSRVAVRNKAHAEVYNKLTASGSYARGHVDCTEIIQDNGSVSAVPIVEVKNPKAHITHEAALGSVDSKQLQTLMARGLSEEEATDLIIQGLLQ